MITFNLLPGIDAVATIKRDGQEPPMEGNRVRIKTTLVLPVNIPDEIKFGDKVLEDAEG